MQHWQVDLGYLHYNIIQYYNLIWNCEDCEEGRFLSDWLLIVPTAELGAGAVGNTLDLEAHREADEVIWTLAGSAQPSRGNQTQMAAGEMMGGAGVVTWEMRYLNIKPQSILGSSSMWHYEYKHLQFKCTYCEAACMGGRHECHRAGVCYCPWLLAARQCTYGPSQLCVCSSLSSRPSPQTGIQQRHGGGSQKWLCAGSGHPCLQSWRLKQRRVNTVDIATSTVLYGSESHRCILD